LVALYATWYNFARINSSVRMSPAMAARLTDQLWDIGDIVKLIENVEATQTNTISILPHRAIGHSVRPCLPWHYRLKSFPPSARWRMVLMMALNHADMLSGCVS
jgi:hypothetical protein